MIVYNGKLSLRLCLILATSSVLPGCTEPSSPLSTNSSALAAPKAISTLHDKGVGDINVRVLVNEKVIIENAPVLTSQSQFQLDASLFSQATNTLEVSFWLTPEAENFNDTPRLLADADIIISSLGPGASLVLPPLRYRYNDSDRDTIADIHEWLVNPVDIDLDNLPNSEDPDSDNDGLTDQRDETPYGDSLSLKPIDTLPAIRIEFSDASLVSLPFVYDSQSAWPANTKSPEPIPVREPAGWPFSTDQFPTTTMASRYTWQIINVESYVRRNCPDWRIGVDASSFQSTINGAALMYFSRNDSTAVLTPISSGSVDSLRNTTAMVPSQQPGVDTNALLDEALRAIIVAPLSTGWISIWSEPSYTGNACSINVTDLKKVYE